MWFKMMVLAPINAKVPRKERCFIVGKRGSRILARGRCYLGFPRKR